MFGLDIFTRGLHDKPMHFNQMNLGTKLLDDPIRKMQRTPALPKVKADIGPSWLLQPITDIPTFRHAVSQDSDYMRKLFPERGQPIYETLLKVPNIPRSWSRLDRETNLGVPKGTKITSLINPQAESLESILSGLRKVTQPPQETDVYNESTSDQRSDSFDNTSNQQSDRLESAPQPIPVHPVLTGGFEESKTNHDIPRAPLPPRLTHHLEHQTLDDDEEPQPVSYKSPSPEPQEDVHGVKSEAIPATAEKPKEAVTPSPSPKKKKKHNKAPAKASEFDSSTAAMMEHFSIYNIPMWEEHTLVKYTKGKNIQREIEGYKGKEQTYPEEKCLSAIKYADDLAYFLDQRYKIESKIPGVNKSTFEVRSDGEVDEFGTQPASTILTFVTKVLKDKMDTETKAKIDSIRTKISQYKQNIGGLQKRLLDKKPEVR